MSWPFLEFDVVAVLTDRQTAAGLSRIVITVRLPALVRSRLVLRGEGHFPTTMQIGRLSRLLKLKKSNLDPVWVPTVFTKNRDRPLSTEMLDKVMAAPLAHREIAPLLSHDHVSVDGTLVKSLGLDVELPAECRSGPTDDEGPGDLTRADGHAEWRAALEWFTGIPRGRPGG